MRAQGRVGAADLRPPAEHGDQPTQTATGESPTTLKTSGVKINITEFDRSKSW
ncbi:hypothetical protein GCM10010103_25810 [Streptomyces paradoxus]|uniref:Uncharacterized protein n=1 Tax=Streptomyces paradoxus TaxID=66375 RepID=A0A7W9T963_9ACTN|nr:hypothetical protein [Streptomyces paradoxus]MBB6076374.1 hypothetical protein [Streptomyces paradoxus]